MVTAQTSVSLILVAVPVLAALLGLLMRGSPAALKDWLLIATGFSLGTIAWAAGTLSTGSGGLFLLALLPVMAFITLLGQPLHRSNAVPWILTVLLVGVGLGVLAAGALVSVIFFVLLLSIIGLILFRYRRRTGWDAWWGIGTLALGALGATVALTNVSPVSSIALALACAVAMPLVPFHKGYVAVLTGLPGNLPAFLALVLPVMGFHGLMTALPYLPDTSAHAIGMLALAGMLYGSLKALMQFRAASVVAYGGLAFLSIAWWSVIIGRAAIPQTVVYLGAVALATAGLLLAWHMLRVRYGEIGLRALTGLAQPMPRFAIAVSLLAVATLGLPPFGVFSGFVGLLLAPSFTWSGWLLVMFIAWLSASWYVFELVQGLLFGREQSRRRHEDLCAPELASLAIVLVLLLALGVMPSYLFDLGGPGLAPVEPTAVMEFSAWSP